MLQIESFSRLFQADRRRGGLSWARASCEDQPAMPNNVVPTTPRANTRERRRFFKALLLYRNDLQDRPPLPPGRAVHPISLAATPAGSAMDAAKKSVKPTQLAGTIRAATRLLMYHHAHPFPRSLPSVTCFPGRSRHADFPPRHDPRENQGRIVSRNWEPCNLLFHTKLRFMTRLGDPAPSLFPPAYTHQTRRPRRKARRISPAGPPRQAVDQ